MSKVYLYEDLRRRGVRFTRARILKLAAEGLPRPIVCERLGLTKCELENYVRGYGVKFAPWEGWLP